MDTPRSLGLPPRTWRTLLVISLVVQVVALYWPFQMDETVSVPGADKMVHFAIFAAPALTAVLAGAPVWLVGVALAAHAPISEVIQGTLISRDPSVYDALADLVGVTTGLLAGRALRRRAAG